MIDIKADGMRLERLDYDAYDDQLVIELLIALKKLYSGIYKTDPASAHEFHAKFITMLVDPDCLAWQPDENVQGLFYEREDGNLVGRVVCD